MKKEDLLQDRKDDLPPITPKPTPTPK